MSRNVRSIALALLLVFVSASAAQAMPRGERPVSLIDRVLSWVGTLLSPEMTSVWGAEGSQMDPNGPPPNNNVPGQSSEEGSSMDPNG